MPNSFAIVPAAGRSRRMGAPKLLLPWGASTVIEHVLAAWQASRTTHTVVVVHPDDEALAEVCRTSGAEVVVPSEPPPDMKVSVRLALEYVTERYAPHERDAWLLAPADMPTLSTDVINRVLAAYQADRSKIIVPVHAGRHGHPALFPWSLAADVAHLAENEGVNRLLARHPVREVECPAEALAVDLDTPEDYRRGHKDRPEG